MFGGNTIVFSSDDEFGIHSDDDIKLDLKNRNFRIRYSGTIPLSDDEKPTNKRKHDYKRFPRGFLISSSSEEEFKYKNIIDKPLKKKYRQNKDSIEYPFSILELRKLVEPYYQVHSVTFTKVSSDRDFCDIIKKADKSFGDGSFSDSEKKYQRVVDYYGGGLYYRTLVLLCRSFSILKNEQKLDSMDILGIINRCDYELTHPQIGEEGDFEICVLMISFLKSYLYLGLKKFMIAQLEMKKILMDEHCHKISNLKEGIQRNIKFVADKMGNSIDPITEMRNLEHRTSIQPASFELASSNMEDQTLKLSEKVYDDEEDVLMDDTSIVENRKSQGSFPASKLNSDMMELEKLLKMQIVSTQDITGISKSSKVEGHGKKDTNQRMLDKILSSSESSEEYEPNIEEKRIEDSEMPEGFRVSGDKVEEEDGEEEEVIVDKGSSSSEFEMEENKKNGEEEKYEIKTKNFQVSESEDDFEVDMKKYYTQKMVYHFYSWAKIKIEDLDMQFPQLKELLKRIDVKIFENESDCRKNE